MKLVKIDTDHYVVVDDSEIKDGDWIYWEGKIVKAVDTSYWSAKKITHSTNILTNGIGILYLSEVKELIGEVDVEQKAKDFIYKQTKIEFGKFHVAPHRVRSYIEGYNQAIEDNKDKKYTEQDLQNAWKIGYRGEPIEELTNYFQPKTEWEVEFDSKGKLKLV